MKCHWYLVAEQAAVRLGGPSGTEPKVKLYGEAVDEDPAPPSCKPSASSRESAIGIWSPSRPLCGRIETLPNPSRHVGRRLDTAPGGAYSTGGGQRVDRKPVSDGGLSELCEQLVLGR